MPNIPEQRAAGYLDQSNPAAPAPIGRGHATGSAGENCKMFRQNGTCFCPHCEPVRAPARATPQEGAGRKDVKMQKGPSKIAVSASLARATCGGSQRWATSARTGCAALLQQNQRNSREKLQSPPADERQLVHSSAQRTRSPISPPSRLRDFALSRFRDPSERESRNRESAKMRKNREGTAGGYRRAPLSRRAGIAANTRATV
jgi:hypothetical protein